MQRCARQGRPVRAGKPRESPAGQYEPRRLGSGPTLPGLPGGRDRRRQLTRSAPESEAARGARPSPRSSSPPRRAPAPARCPAPRAHSHQPSGSRCSDRRRRRSSGRAPPARLRRRDRRRVRGARPSPAGGALPPGRCVRRPRSRPRLCSARSELQVKPRGSRRGPAPPPGPCARSLGLTRALRAPRPSASPAPHVPASRLPQGTT